MVIEWNARSSADADNQRDASSGQSRSTNMTQMQKENRHSICWIQLRITAAAGTMCMNFTNNCVYNGYSPIFRQPLFRQILLKVATNLNPNPNPLHYVHLDCCVPQVVCQFSYIFQLSFCYINCATISMVNKDVYILWTWLRLQPTLSEL